MDVGVFLPILALIFAPAMPLRKIMASKFNCNPTFADKYLSIFDNCVNFVIINFFRQWLIKNLSLLPDRLYLLRASKRFQQNKLAEAIGVEAPTYSRIEKDLRSMKDAQPKMLINILEADCRDLKSLMLADKIDTVVGDSSKDEPEKALEQVKSNLKKYA